MQVQPICAGTLLAVCLFLGLASAARGAQVAECPKDRTGCSDLFVGIKSIFTSGEKVTKLTSGLRETNEKLCKEGTQSDALTRLKQLLQKFERKLLSDTVLDTHESLIKALRQLVTPDILDEEQRFCDLDSTRALDELGFIVDELETELRDKEQTGWKSLFVGAKKPEVKCNKLAELYNIYSERRQSKCPNEYLERFAHLQENLAKRTEGVWRAVSSLASKLAANQADPELKYDPLVQLFLVNEQKHHELSARISKADLFNGTLNAFRLETRLALESPFYYAPTIDSAEELIQEFLVMPCRAFRMSFGEIFEGVRVDSIATLRLGLEPTIKFLPVPEEFYRAWYNYELCDLILTDASGLLDNYGEGITDDLMSDYRQVLIDNKHTEMYAQKARLDVLSL